MTQTDLTLQERTKLAKKKRTKYDDPGHGWLKVSLKDIQKLGLEQKISGCSFQRGGYVYLEEDMDCTNFFLAVAGVENWSDIEGNPEAKELVKMLHENTTTQTAGERYSKIRSYSNYEYVSPEEAVELERIRENMMTLKFWTAKAKREIQNAGKSTLLFWKEHYGI
jgi:hypothetical protein